MHDLDSSRGVSSPRMTLEGTAEASLIAVFLEPSTDWTAFEEQEH